jgi:hypothetical protein
MNVKNQKEIDEIQASISEQCHDLLNAGCTHEEIVLFLEGEKMHWMAKYTHDVLNELEWIKEEA